MTDFVISELNRRYVTLHFGSETNGVDAYTFAQSLISFADTIRAVNDATEPSSRIEVQIEAIGPGSFRAVIRSTKSYLKGLFADADKHALWIGVSLVLSHMLAGDERIVVNDESVVIQKGKDRIILPRDHLDDLTAARKSASVQRHARKTAEEIARDSRITALG